MLNNKLLYIVLTFLIVSAPLSAVSNYIKPDGFAPMDSHPPLYESSDAVMGIYYNVLYPEEPLIDGQNILLAWLRNPDAAFPFSEEQFAKSPPFFLGRSPTVVLQSLFAERVLNHLGKKISLEESMELALIDLKNSTLPDFARKMEMIRERIQSEPQPLVRGRYELLYKALLNCEQDPERELSISRKKYLDHRDEPSLLSFLEADLQRGKELRLPESNRWDHRIVALKENIEKATGAAPHAPYFLALQEVTPHSLDDLKETFPHLTWISYNTTTGEETKSSGQEEVLGEFFSFTATLALSPDLKVVRTEHRELPTVSGSKRMILGAEVYNEITKRHFAIFTLHSDHLVKDNLYQRNVESISAFVEEFTAADHLPFIFGGDLNAFESSGGEEYITGLKLSGPFSGSLDFREAPFFTVPPIAYATFVGHVLDSYKMAIKEENGALLVEPNALDHIFLKDLEIEYSFREAGVYDEEGHLIDPYLDPELFNERLAGRKTASDHFLNAVLFKS